MKVVLIAIFLTSSHFGIINVDEFNTVQECETMQKKLEAQTDKLFKKAKGDNVGHSSVVNYQCIKK